jgi:hypothetical protein
MNSKKVIFLFVAFLLPICIFIFLRIFGKNEFRVEPLFQDSEVKVERNDCGEIILPYRVSSEILQSILTTEDSLAIVCFDNPDGDPLFPRLEEDLKTDPIRFTIAHLGTEANAKWYDCVFLMKHPADIVLVDNKGAIRGQYESADRDEIDRLKTEIAIILKRY